MNLVRFLCKKDTVCAYKKSDTFWYGRFGLIEPQHGCCDSNKMCVRMDFDDCFVAFLP